jgi:hypothetical protein
LSILPALRSEFSLVTVAERVDWSQALPRHLLDRIDAGRAEPWPDWKTEEQVMPMTMLVQDLIAQGATNVPAIEQFFDRSEENRNDYATGQ